MIIQDTVSNLIIHTPCKFDGFWGGVFHNSKMKDGWLHLRPLLSTFRCNLKMSHSQET